MPICSECKNDYSPPTLCGICPDCQQKIVSTNNAIEYQQQKFEEIKKIAMGIYLHSITDYSLGFEECWAEAERIFDFLKKKQEGDE